MEIGIFPVTLPVKTAKGFKREGYGATMPGVGSWLTTHLGKSLNLPVSLFSHLKCNKVVTVPT